MNVTPRYAYERVYATFCSTQEEEETVIRQGQLNKIDGCLSSIAEDVSKWKYLVTWQVEIIASHNYQGEA